MTSFASVAGSSGSELILPPRTPAANFDPPNGPVLPALTLINEARSAEEGLGPLGLVLSRYDALSVPEQLFVLVNLERISRGEQPGYALISKLDTVSAQGAQQRRDPSPPPNWPYDYHVIWSTAGTSPTQAAFQADWGWMYEDGPPPYHGWTNYGCARAGALGCWVHRNAILELRPTSLANDKQAVLVMGAGAAPNSTLGYSLAMEFSWFATKPTSGVVFTWAQALKVLGQTQTTATTTTTTTAAPTTTTSTTTTTTLSSSG
ncbi:MAG: hypothetical protein WAN30_04250 [Acidimicrobiales bacterium]